ncbi:TrmH family RNA methyltransferase [Candidatus Neptunochlamydia vexilliferae]|nr:RNA methyltransferase [Candidatus Neptunochlamydia vexilliferae]
MLEELLQTYSKEGIIHHLHTFLTEERIARIDQVLACRLNSIEVALEAPYDIHNGLAVIRTAEALGVSQLHFINAQMKKGQGKNTTKGTLKWTRLTRHETLEDFLNKKKVLIAGACAEGEVPLEELPLDLPLCFLFGNEREGLSEEAKQQADILFKVPMYGMVESLNLSVAAAITLYDFLKRKRAHLGKEGDFTKQEILEEKARFYIRSLGIEQSNEILKRSLS